MKTDSNEYFERVYAGVLGKVIGVTTGKPIEGWSYDRIQKELGDIDGYVHDRLGYPLICTDDDTSGTFTFLRAIEDNGYRLDLTSQEIGETWLNYLVEGKSVLWWGGFGNSTEHTAYLRLKKGISAPKSGSCKLNGKRVSEQIGAQIFIDGWAMVHPGDPERAAAMAIEAARVSHDGEAVFGAAALAAMEALAFDEPDLDKLVDCGLRQIPANSLIAQVIRGVRVWSRENGDDWRKTRLQVEAKYGADQYGVGHMIPNHALIHLALHHGKGDFARSLNIVNTCGWDTDCNAGNLGCLLGIRAGLGGIPGNLRDPIADRLYLPTADAGQGISDCYAEAQAIVNMARIPRGQNPIITKRFSFGLPGAVQGYRSENCRVSNLDGEGLAIHYTGEPDSIVTPTFLPPNLEDMHGYELLASPTIYPGQRFSASVCGPLGVQAAVLLKYFGQDGQACEWLGESVELNSLSVDLRCTVPDLGGYPIFEAGLRLTGQASGTVHVQWIDWSGTPFVDILKGKLGSITLQGWAHDIDQLGMWTNSEQTTLAITQNNATGTAIYGCRDWKDYRLEATIVPRLGGRFGMAINCQGLRRYLALMVGSDGEVELGCMLGEWRTLARGQVQVQLEEPMLVSLESTPAGIRARVNDAELECVDIEALANGAIALIAQEARFDVHSLKIAPVVACD